MKKYLQIMPIALVAVTALAGCNTASTESASSGSDSTGTSTSENQWWDEITSKYAVGDTISAEDAEALLSEDSIAAYDSDYVSQTDYQRYYYPVNWYPEYAEDLEYEYTLTYYDNDVVGVSGSYYHRLWDGVSEDPDVAQWATPVSYSFDEYLWNDSTANTLNCLYTRNGSASDAYSFYKTGDMDWNAYDEIHAKTTQSANAAVYYSDTMTQWNSFVASASSYSYPISSGYTGTVSQYRGKTSVEVQFYGTIETLALYSCYQAGWGSDYLHRYAERFYTFEFTLTFTEKQLVTIYADFGSFIQTIYDDKNAYDETQEPAPGEEDIPYVDDEWLAKLDLVENTQLSGMVLPAYASTEYSYTSAGDATIPDTSSYRESGPDDVGDNFYFDVSDLF